jgi:hypothetical protein
MEQNDISNTNRLHNIHIEMDLAKEMHSFDLPLVNRKKLSENVNNVLQWIKQCFFKLQTFVLHFSTDFMNKLIINCLTISAVL